jgi:nucleoside-diphosphate-sugar epimerase
VTAAVTGATGFVGRFIVDRLIEGGVAVRAWRRASSDLRGLPSSVEWIEGDLASPRAAESLLNGADMLVHAALDHLPGRYRGGEGGDLAGYVETNVGGSLALLAKARQAGIRRCVVVSSRAVFGASGRVGPLSDDAPVRPDTHYGAAKAALEVFVQSWGRGEGWPIAALRPTGVYGMVVPAEKSKWFDLVARVLKREPVPSRAGSEVHGRDVAEAVWRLLNAAPAEVAGRAFNCCDIVVSTRDIVRLVHRAAAISGPLPKPAPAPVNVMGRDSLDRLGVIFGGWPLFEATIEELVAAAQTRSGSGFGRQSDAG